MEEDEAVMRASRKALASRMWSLPEDDALAAARKALRRKPRRRTQLGAMRSAMTAALLKKKDLAATRQATRQVAAVYSRLGGGEAQDEEGEAGEAGTDPLIEDSAMSLPLSTLQNATARL